MTSQSDKSDNFPEVVLRVGDAVLPSEVDNYLKVQDTEARLQRLQTIVQAWEEQQKEERRLRKTYANALMWFLGIELLIIFLAFFLVGTNFLHVEQWTVDVFLVATLAQSSSLLLIVVKYLFPERSADILKLLEVAGASQTSIQKDDYESARKS